GRMLYANGDVYNGEWKDGEPYGQGKMKWANGDTYSGGWKKGKLHGRGVFEEKGGCEWDGIWNANARTGDFSVHGKRYLFQQAYEAKSGKSLWLQTRAATTYRWFRHPAPAY
ncbi:MAG: hypothetical protein II039_09130, partial [Treponema sp.]|nr:hypothetical protein [Treponema sp.]